MSNRGQQSTIAIKYEIPSGTGDPCKERKKKTKKLFFSCPRFNAHLVIGS
jgi:hypothetical protein